VAEATDDWDEQSPAVVRDLVDALLGIALAP
jgi:L-cysteine:1D-myo-inositol 2-amino-2-deoxy-alpha-D-glucopyranoside ligase